LPKARDIPTKVNLADNKAHTVIYDPDADVKEQVGQGGRTYYTTSVTEAGRPALLNMGNRLLSAINELNLNKPTKISIKRVGESFQTEYEVSKV